MDLGFVYFVFLPSIVTTLLAGRAVARFGTRPAIWGALAVAAIGLPLMLSSHLSEVLIGMVLVGVGNASFSRRNFKIVVMVMAIVRYFDRVAWHAQSR